MVAGGGAAAGLALLAVGCGSVPAKTPSPERTTPSSSSSPTTFPGVAMPSPLPSGSASSCKGAGPAVLDNGGTAGPAPALASVQFVSAERGWAAGAGRILATSDGGRTWQRQYDGPAQLYEADFVDAAHGWAAGPGSLLGTADGGATWTPLSDPCGAIDSVHFVTPEVGYAVAGGSQVRIDGGVPAAVDGGDLLMTTDGGRAWHTVPGAPAQVESVCFATTADGFLGTAGKIWRSTDGGRQWAVSFTEPAKSAALPSQPGDTAALQCAGPDAAWVDFLGFGAALGHSPYIAYATQDARHWRPLFEESYTESAALPEVHAPDGPGSYPGPFSAIGPDSAAFIGWNPPQGFGAAPVDMVTGGTKLSKDGDVGGMTRAFGAAFLSPAQGWVVGTDQTSSGSPGDYVIEATADGGRTWAREYAVS